MSVKDIGFPNLGILLENVPKSFDIFGFELAMYGIVITIAVAAGFCMWLKLAKVDGMNPDLFWDFSIYAIIFCIIGARLYYVIFAWDMYKDDLKEIFNIRNGGLAIYGAVIAAFITAAVFCKIKKVKLLKFADIGVAGLILGQIIGRWANFFNREAFGDYTNNLFAMRLPVDMIRKSEITDTMAANIQVVDGIECVSVHPTFLYESAWNVMVLILILLYFKRKKFDGEIVLLYLGGYGLGRFFVEGLRTDQLKWFGTDIAVSQMLGITLFIACLGTRIVIALMNQKKKILKTIKEEQDVADASEDSLADSKATDDTENN
ncbi:MAG: prolipoprotein diacylglyceryl transferase [Lachnospiraceae bacterium]|nr:prolipoprotein diacylglyceryl transferase [Lachnospiraceae bacterium]